MRSCGWGLHHCLISCCTHMAISAGRGLVTMVGWVSTFCTFLTPGGGFASLGTHCSDWAVNHISLGCSGSQELKVALLMWWHCFSHTSLWAANVCSGSQELKVALLMWWHCFSHTSLWAANVCSGSQELKVALSRWWHCFSHTSLWAANVCSGSQELKLPVKVVALFFCTYHFAPFNTSV